MRYNEIGFKEGQSGNLSDATNGVLPVLLLDQDGSSNDQGPAGSSINSVYLSAPTGADSLNGQSVNFAYYHEPLSKIWQYNLEVQRELTPNMVANIAYVGSHGFDQLFGVDLNQIPADKLSVDDIDGCLGGVGPCYRPYPNYQSIGGSKLIGISNYNALQATIQKRLSNGLISTSTTPGRTSWTRQIPAHGIALSQLSRTCTMPGRTMGHPRLMSARCSKDAWFTNYPLEKGRNS